MGLHFNSVCYLSQGKARLAKKAGGGYLGASKLGPAPGAWSTEYALLLEINQLPFSAFLASRARKIEQRENINVNGKPYKRK